MIVVRVILPRWMSDTSVWYEQPGLKGWASSRMNHGPMLFVVAWRERGSSRPRHWEHRAPAGVMEPQYGHKAAAGSVFTGEPESETAVEDVDSIASHGPSFMAKPLVRAPRHSRRTSETTDTLRICIG